MKTGLTPIARKLRKDPTDAEKVLWQFLRRRGMGCKFRRQAVIGRYIVDFVCFERKMVIELDGGQHSESREDMVRDAWLTGEGFVVRRFWNSEVLGNLEGVVEEIEECLKAPLPGPPRRGEGMRSESSPRKGEGKE